MSFYTYKAVVKRVIDGDTIVVDIDVGFHMWLRDQHIRLAHINAPELGTEAGRTAKIYLETLLEIPLIVNPMVRLETIKDRQDNYGRYLGVFLTVKDININQAMVAGGHAVPSEGRHV